VEVEDFEPDIIDLDDESCLVSFGVEVRSFVQVEGPDFTNGIYDRENGRVFTLDRTLREDEQEIEFEVEVELDLGVKNGKFEIEDMRVHVLGLSSGIEVAVEEEDFHNYK
jgi:hypothetical protein